MDYTKAIEIGKGVYWVGYNDKTHGLHSNPYLLIDGEEAVLIDGGSRPDFSTVMMKILQTGFHPDNIVRLIYQHYDPDLVGSVANFENVIHNGELEIISQKQNNVFIKHYSVSAPLRCVNKIGNSWGFRTGRKLVFINTPYAHSPGSFVTYDADSKTLFTSDIFGAYGTEWDLYMELTEHCETCNTYEACPMGKEKCFMPGIIKFHQVIMTSKSALRFALDQMRELDIELIAPQHGSLIKGKKNIEILLNKLYSIEDIGVDGVNLTGVDHVC